MKSDPLFIAFLGQTMRAFRQARNLSQYQLADLSGCSRQHIIKLEKGTQDARVYTLFKLAQAMDTPLEEIAAALGKKIQEENYTPPPIEDTEDKK